MPERFPAALGFGAREYLQHMARIHGLSGTDVRTAVDEWLERLGATEYAQTPLRTLSKGMCQKVAIAQALLSMPGLLVLDEAWTGLDQAARGALDAAVAERLAAGGTVLFVDHDPARLADLVDERWRLAGGTVAVVAGGGPAVWDQAVSGGGAGDRAVRGGGVRNRVVRTVQGGGVGDRAIRGGGVRNRVVRTVQGRGVRDPVAMGEAVRGRAVPSGQRRRRIRQTGPKTPGLTDDRFAQVPGR